MHNLYLEKEEPQVLARQRQITIQRQQQQHPIPPVIKPRVSEFIYRRVFNTEFNLGFGLPRTDTCAACDRLNFQINSNPNDSEAQEDELRRHQEKADQGYKSMRNDQKAAIGSWSGRRRILGEAAYCSKDAVDMISFDFQQNLPTPNLHHNDVFYARQLWTYNFGIHDCVAGKGYMYMWNEMVAKRGSSEVASCLQTFLETNCTGAKSLVSYSDGCAGQNKNLTIIGLYSELHRNGLYDVINHKFLTRGHTFLRNDTDFTQIEKRKASARAHVPEDWCKVVREANRRNPFQVVSMDQEEFWNYKEFMTSKYTNKYFAKGGVSFRMVHWLNFGWGEEVEEGTGRITMVHHPDELWMRYSYSDQEPWKKVKFLKDRPSAVPLQRMYTSPLRLNPAKIQDLKKMARDHLPAPARAFYLSMRDGDSSGAETEDESFSD